MSPGTRPDSASWGMDWIGFVPGKRGEPEDAVALGGWPMDDHPPSGFDAWTQPPFRSIPLPDVYRIPLRCLYSRNIANLWISASADALTVS